MELPLYWAALKRRWVWFVLTVLVVCGAVFSVVRKQEQRAVFSATSKIFVASATSTVTAEDVAQLAMSSAVAEDTCRFLMSPEPDPAELARTIDRMKGQGYELLDSATGAVQQVSSAQALAMKQEDLEKDARQLFSQAYKFRAPIPPAALIQQVRAEVVSSGVNRTGSGVVVITAVAVNKADAVNIANTVAEKAKQRALGLTQLGIIQSAAYVEPQLKAARKRFALAQQKLKQFQEAHKDLIVPLDFDQARQVVNDLEAQARDAEANIQENQNRVRELKRVLGTRSQAKLQANSAPSDAVVSRLQGSIAEQEVALAALKLKYTNDNPKVRQAEQLIDTLKERLNAELRKSYDIGNAPASLEYQFITGDISRFQAESMAARAKQSALKRIAGKAKGQLSVVPGLEAKYAQLNTEYTAAQENLLKLQDSYDSTMTNIRVAQKQEEAKQGIGLIDYAIEANETPGSKLQSKKARMAMAFVVACILGMGLVLLLESWDTRIRDVDQVEDRYQLPVLGVIPELREIPLHGGSSLVLRDSPGSPYSEPYRILRANFLALASQTAARSVVITSTLPGEGKTTTAANFAMSLVEGHHRVVLIDADMRNPSLHKAFGIRKDPGLSNYLSGECSLEDVLFPTDYDGLVVISAGNIPENPSRLLNSSRMKELLEELSHQADYVVIDTPPAVAFSDAMDIGAMADSMVVVVGAGSKLESAHFRARAHLANVRAVLVGTVLNRVQVSEVDSYRYSTRYYGSSNGKSGKLPFLPRRRKQEQAALPDRTE